MKSLITNKVLRCLKIVDENPGILLGPFASKFYGDTGRKRIESAASYLRLQVDKGRIRREKPGGLHRYYITREGAKILQGDYSEGPEYSSGFRVGQKVRYMNQMTGKAEKGIVKKFPKKEENKGWVWVVFECGGNWVNYDKYRAAACKADYLVPGWE
jgi:hypothetical protein